ncbi:MAG: hypothetical protein LBK76_04470 [Verrucomicrobiales bacterium]|jgi:hypothetical protein|nr:hypothetical protein [Verrucomicrobiales bacterium]
MSDPQLKFKIGADPAAVVRYRFVNCVVPAGFPASVSADGRFEFVNCNEMGE